MTITGQLTAVVETDEEYTQALASFNASDSMFNVVGDPENKTITFEYNWGV